MQSSTRIYKIYVGLVAAILIGGSIYSSITQSDMFPFAAFMMYSSPQKAEDLYLLKSFCHKKDGSVVAVSEFDTWAQEFDYFLYIDRTANLPLAGEPLATCQKDIGRLLTDLADQGCIKLTLKRYYWKQFSGPVALTPDKNEFVCEAGILDGH
jgi:hypothetical protein